MEIFNWPLEECMGENKPYLKAYLLDRMPKEREQLPAIMICPGGGYSHLSPREAEPVALAFAARGYQAFVLYYSILPKKYPQPLIDAAKAMAAIRSHGHEWRVDPQRIAVCGFSAGGHLAGAISTLADDPAIIQAGFTAQQVRPNASILCYAVLSMPEGDQKSLYFVNDILQIGEHSELQRAASLDKAVTKENPPTFLWHTAGDHTVIPSHSLRMAEALSQNEVPFEMHIFPRGDHGLALATERTCNGSPDMVIPEAAQWMNLCCDWLERTL